jgi:hypothetical protein
MPLVRQDIVLSRGSYPRGVVDLATRVLVRLNDSLPMTVEQINDALGQSLTWRAARSPGVPATVEALAVLERRGHARQSEGGWILTRAGMQLYGSLEDRFENSGQHGNYGF